MNRRAPCVADYLQLFEPKVSESAHGSMGPGPSAKGGFAEDEGGVPFGEAPP